jgi:hypothetical protein
MYLILLLNRIEVIPYRTQGKVGPFSRAYGITHSDKSVPIGGNVMELTDDMLRRIANTIVDLTNQTRALKIILVEQLHVDPQLVDKLMQEPQEPQHQLQYQSTCDQLFEHLKGSD